MSTEGADQGAPNARGRKSVSWRKDLTILERLPKVEKRHHDGWSNVAIAAELEVDETTIRRDLERLEELWRERFGGEIERQRLARIAELADIKARALAAAQFDEAAERAVLLGEEMQGADGKTHFVQRDAKGSAQFRGNKAAALAVARAASVDIAKVQGVYVEKQDVTSGGKSVDSWAALLLAAHQGGADKAPPGGG